jgi:hypothetical protein
MSESFAVIVFTDGPADMPLDEVFDKGGYIAELGGERIVRLPVKNEGTSNDFNS